MCQSSSTHLNRFLSASAWSSLGSWIICRKLYLLTSLLMCCSSHHHGKQFSSILTKLLTSTCTFTFQNLSSHYVVGIVGKIFNPDMVNTIFCMFTAALALSDSMCILDSLAYIESITDATNDIEPIENNFVNSANYNFNKFSASTFLCSLIISAENTAWWPNSLWYSSSRK